MEYIVFLGVLVLGMIFWFVNGVLQERKARIRFEDKLNHLEGKLPDKKYPLEYFLFAGEHANLAKETFCVDEITWNDLSMDEVFKRMDYTYCAAGEDMLYRILKTPVFSKEELKHRGEIITYFEENPKQRVKLQLLYAKIGRTGKYSIYEYLDYLEALEVKGNGKNIAVLCGMVLSGAMIFVNAKVGILLLCALVIGNFISYLKMKGEVEPYITTFAYIMRLLDNTQEIINTDVAVLSEELETLKKHAALFERFKRGAFIVLRGQNLSGNPFEMIWDYICMIFHFDLMKFNSMHKLVATHHDELKEMFDIVGFIEAMISVALYRKSIAGYCEPEFTDDGEMLLCANDVYHPLLKNPVANTIQCKKGVLLTGSNASGKSTFLKTVAINAILAQTINTCMATAYRTSFFRVYSSMSLRDDIIGGDSYFIVEIKAIKRIIDASGESGKAPVLSFVDEVLRGTNTVERIAASAEILKALQKGNAMCFAATHDLELTKLLADDFDNYHFEEKLEENDVTFAYQLLPGEATSRNAIELLRVLGFEKDIIEKAHENARRYDNGQLISTGVKV